MKRENGKRTQEWQEWVLGRLVEGVFVRTAKGVKGSFTTADFVMWSLNEIFGPSNWSLRVLDGPKLVTYSTAMAYSQATVQLTVRFADGHEVVHEEVGIWPMRATKSVGTLDKTTPEIYEQVLKSAVTDGLKACTDHLGRCFRPIADKELEGFLLRRQAQESLKEKRISTEGESAEKSNNDLFGEETTEVELEGEPVRISTDGNGVIEPAPYPRTIDELYKMADSDLGISSKDSYAVMQRHLNEQFGEGADIAAYVKTGSSEAVLTLWDVVKASITG